MPRQQAKRIEVGSRLRESRRQAKLSLEEVSSETHSSTSTISAWENGARTISAFKLADLCLLYGVSSDFILFGTHMVPDDLRALFAREGREGRSSGSRS